MFVSKEKTNHLSDGVFGRKRFFTLIYFAKLINEKDWIMCWKYQ
jgi:hypothetical protein